MGKRIIHCGGAGAGQAAKMCNNMMLGATQIAIGEAFVLAEKLGLSAQALFDVASASRQLLVAHTNCPVPGPVPTSPANNDYKPGFATALMLKDLRLAREAEKATGQQRRSARKPRKSTHCSSQPAMRAMISPASSISFAAARLDLGVPHVCAAALR